VIDDGSHYSSSSALPSTGITSIEGCSLLPFRLMISVLIARAEPMAISARPTPSARLKQALEIKKLQTDILFVKLSFAAQVLNAIGITVVGILVLFYFQRPQIEQMEASRLATERQQIALAIERAIDTADPAQRATKFKILNEIFPNQPAIKIAEETQKLLDVRINPVESVEQCGQAISSVNQLQAGRDRLATELKAEVTGARSGSLAGFGPVARGLQNQLAELDAKIEDAKRMVASRCPPQFIR
jgi:hypothetical protein